MLGRGSISFPVFIVSLVIAHLILHVALGFGATAPDLLTIAVLLAARRVTGVVAAGIGFVLGVLIDALSLTAFGVSAFIYALIGLLGARSRNLFEGESALFLAFYTFLGKWLHDALYFVLIRAGHGEPWSELVTAAPLAAAYAAFAAIVALTLYRAATGDH